MPAMGRKGGTLTVTGRAKLISDGMFRSRGPLLVSIGGDGFYC